MTHCLFLMLSFLSGILFSGCGDDAIHRNRTKPDIPEEEIVGKQSTNNDGIPGEDNRNRNSSLDLLREPLESDAQSTSDTQDAQSTDQDAQSTDQDAQSTSDQDAQSTSDQDAQSTSDQDAQSTDQDAQSTDQDAQSTSDQDAQSTDQDAQSTSDQDAQSTSDQDAQSTDQDAQSTSDQDAQSTDQDAQSTSDQDAQSTSNVWRVYRTHNFRKNVKNSENENQQRSFLDRIIPNNRTDYEPKGRQTNEIIPSNLEDTEFIRPCHGWSCMFHKKIVLHELSSFD